MNKPLEEISRGFLWAIGTPKQPTFSVYHWVDGEYQVTLFCGEEAISSPTFPALELTLAQVMQKTQF